VLVAELQKFAVRVSAESHHYGNANLFEWFHVVSRGNGESPPVTCGSAQLSTTKARDRNPRAYYLLCVFYVHLVVDECSYRAGPQRLVNG
jgi:hypothetical protein